MNAEIGCLIIPQTAWNVHFFSGGARAQKIPRKTLDNSGKEGYDNQRESILNNQNGKDFTMTPDTNYMHISHGPFHVGQRSIKTAAAATLVALIYLIFGGNPTFACIGAIFGLGNDMSMSRLNGGNRFFGTIIGGMVGIALFRLYIMIVPDGHQTALTLLFLFIGVVVLIIAAFTYYTSVAQDQPFFSRFREMALISVGVAVLSFVVGVLAKRLLGVDI